MTGQAVAERVSVNQIGMSATAGGGALAPQNLGDVVRFAEVMSKADIAIPPHLRGNPGACLAVTMQAMRWEMDPFAVASKTYLVNKTIAYEAQLIAAVINTRAGLKRRLSITFEGEGQDRRCIVTGEFTDGAVQVYTSPPFGSITPKNSPLWKSDPDQQHAYFSTRSFGRRFCPEVILGVYDRDELAVEIRNITPPADTSPAMARLAAARAAQEPVALPPITEHVEAEIAAMGPLDGEGEGSRDEVVDEVVDAEFDGCSDAAPAPIDQAFAVALREFSEALFRADSKRALGAYATAFWEAREDCPDPGSPERALTDRIFNQHSSRVDGALDAPHCRAAVEQIISEVM